MGNCHPFRMDADQVTAYRTEQNRKEIKKEKQQKARRDQKKERREQKEQRKTKRANRWSILTPPS